MFILVADAVSVRFSLPFFLFLVILNLHVIPALLTSLFVLLIISGAYYLACAGPRLHTFHGPLPLFFTPSFPIFCPFPFFPLETGPLNTANGPGSNVSSPSGVWGAAQAEIEIGAFNLKIVTNILHCIWRVIFALKIWAP